MYQHLCLQLHLSCKLWRQNLQKVATPNRVPAPDPELLIWHYWIDSCQFFTKLVRTNAKSATSLTPINMHNPCTKLQFQFFLTVMNGVKIISSKSYSLCPYAHETFTSTHETLTTAYILDTPLRKGSKHITSHHIQYNSHFIAILGMCLLLCGTVLYISVVNDKTMNAGTVELVLY